MCFIALCSTPLALEIESTPTNAQPTSTAHFSIITAQRRISYRTCTFAQESWKVQQRIGRSAYTVMHEREINSTAAPGFLRGDGREISPLGLRDPLPSLSHAGQSRATMEAKKERRRNTPSSHGNSHQKVLLSAGAIWRNVETSVVGRFSCTLVVGLGWCLLGGTCGVWCLGVD
jgi:hypothetical protein